MKKLLLLSGAALCVLANPAFAKKFSGPFLGLNIGYTFGEIDYNYEDGTTGNGDFSESDDYSGVEYGAFAGFRHQFDSGFNLGLEGGYNASQGDGSYGVSVGANSFDFDYEKESEWYVSLKPGFLVDDSTLVYGIGGYQEAKFDSTLLINGVALGSQDDTFSGYHVGAGVEKSLANGLSLRGEYRYNDYGDNDYTAANGQVETFEGDESVIRVGLTYNFQANKE